MTAPPPAPVDRASLRRELEDLAALLDEVLDLADAHALFEPEPGEGAADEEPATTVAGQTAPQRADYQYARDLVVALAAAVDDLDEPDAERLELNADLRQFHFHLAEELDAARAGGVDPAVLRRSLTFLKRHIVRLRAEYEHGQHLAVDPDERELLVRLARRCRSEFFRRWAPAYDAVGYRRPYLDKFYRDYSLTGIPDGLLLTLAELAEAPVPEGGYDRFLCILKGGMAFTAMLGLLGVPDERILHAMAGRASGSHYEDDYRFRLLDAEPDALRGQAVLVVENNLATGATLTCVAREVAATAPRRVGVFLDYLLTDLAGIDADNLRDRVGYPFDAVHLGPWPTRSGDAEERARAAELRARLLAALRADPER